MRCCRASTASSGLTEADWFCRCVIDAIAPYLVLTNLVMSTHTPGTGPLHKTMVVIDRPVSAIIPQWQGGQPPDRSTRGRALLAAGLALARP